MAQPKRTLTPAQRRAKARRRQMFTTIFVNGKQRRVRRPKLVLRLKLIPRDFGPNP